MWKEDKKYILFSVLQVLFAISFGLWVSVSKVETPREEKTNVEIPPRIKEVQLVTKVFRAEQLQNIAKMSSKLVLVQTGYDVEEILRTSTGVAVTAVTDFNILLENGETVYFRIDQVSLKR
jgi:hypothetical protein